MKWLSLAVFAVFGLLLLLRRGPLLWDAGWLALADTAVTPPVSLTAWGECQQAHQTGRALLLQGEAAEALPYLQMAVTCNTSRWAWFDLGRAQYALGQDEAAAQSWQNAAAYGYVVRLATHAQSHGDSAEARRGWETAVQIDPQNGLAYVQLGELLVASDPEQAQQFYDQAITAQPDYAPAYYAQARLFMSQPGGLERALPYFEQAHQLEPQNVEYLVVLARQTASVNPAQALDYWQELADMAEQQRPLAYFEMGYLWLQQGEVAEAVHYLQMATEGQPESAEFWQALAQAYEAAGCPAEAIAAYEQVASLQPDSALAENAGVRVAELGSVTGDCLGVRSP